MTADQPGRRRARATSKYQTRLAAASDQHIGVAGWNPNRMTSVVRGPRQTGPGNAEPNMSGSIGYPPLDRLKSVADSVWIVDAQPIKAGGLLLPVRMTVVKLSGGGLLLYSPVRYKPGLQGEIESLGPIRHIVAPNVGHWMFVRDWQRACPDAATWAVPELRHRAQVRAAGMRIDHDLGPVAPDEWRNEIDQVLVQSSFFTEVDMLHRASRTLMVADLVLNVEGQGMPPLSRMISKALGILAPDGRAPLYLRLLLRLNRTAVAHAAARLVAMEPRRVIVSHGRPFEHDATARLQHSLNWLLGTAKEPVYGGSAGRPVTPARGRSSMRRLVGFALVVCIGAALAVRRNRRGSR